METVLGGRLRCKWRDFIINAHLLMVAFATGFLRMDLRRKAANTLDFIDHVIEEIPFPIQRFQTGQGREGKGREGSFFTVKVQEKLTA